MASVYDQMLACSVIVGDGSGVLIQPMSDEYSYVLTAKHVVAAHIDEINKVQVENVEGKIILISDCLIDPVHDIAILKTSEAISSDLSPCIDKVKANEKLHLLGYPNTRRTEFNNKNKSRDFPGQATVQIESDIFSVELNTQPDIDQLKGISGCGVFREVDGVIYLCGVEAKVEGNQPSNEFHGRVECVPLSKFDELISYNSDNYVQILPAYLLSFSYVKEHTFGFNGVGTPESVSYLKSVLHNTIQLFITEKSLPTPKVLFDKYNKALLIHQSSAEDALNLRLWIALLEFMIITSLIDEQHPINIYDLEKQFSRRRFLFSASEINWNMLLQKIFQSELSGLGTNGVVIIDAGECKGSISPTELTLKNVISNIGRCDCTNFRIDAPIKNPAKAFKFYHWQGLHRVCVIEKEDDYAEFNHFEDGKDATAVQTKIKEEYAQFLGK